MRSRPFRALALFCCRLIAARNSWGAFRTLLGRGRDCCSFTSGGGACWSASSVDVEGRLHSSFPRHGASASSASSFREGTSGWHVLALCGWDLVGGRSREEESPCFGRGFMIFLKVRWAKEVIIKRENASPPLLLDRSRTACVTVHADTLIGNPVLYPSVLKLMNRQTSERTLLENKNITNK